MTAIKQIFVTLLLLPNVCFAADTLITSWASGHGWVKNGTVTVTDDTSVYYAGTQSLKAVTAGTGATDKIQRFAISPTIDMTNKFFKIVLRVSDWSKVTTFKMHTSSDNYTTMYECQLKAAGEKYPTNEWVTITVPWSYCTNAVGTPVKNAINVFQFWLVDTGSPVTINFGALYAVDNPHTGYVTFTFDDGYVGNYTNAAPALAKWSFSGSAFPIWEYSTLASHTSVAQDQSLRFAYGWDLGLHADTNWTTLSSGDLATYVGTSQAVFQNRSYSDGLTSITVYPYGGVNPTVLSVMDSTGINWARSTINTTETIPPQSPTMIRNVMIGNTDAVADVKYVIDRAMTNKEWIVLTYHSIETPADEYGKTTPADFASVVDYVAGKNYPVRTFSQMRSVVNALNEGLGPFTYTSKCGGLREDFLSATSKNDFVIPKRINNSTNCQRN